MAVQPKAQFAQNLTKQQLIELDACVNCGECLKWCPIQDVTKDPSLSPPERIRLYKHFIENETGILPSLFGRKENSNEQKERFRDILWKCVLCGNCGHVCEVGIDSKKLWWTLRRNARNLIGTPAPLEGPVKCYNDYRNAMPKPLKDKYKIWLPREVRIAETADIGLYEGCGGAWDCPQSAEGAIRLLSAGGPVTLPDPEEAWCCGWPMVAGSGEWGILPDLVSSFIRAVEKKGIKRLALICPMCRDIMMWVYPEVLGHDLPFEPVMVSEIVAEYVKEGRIEFTKSLNDIVTVHDPCALARPLVGAPVLEAPRVVVDALPGVERVEMDRTGENTRCCGGSAGQRPLNPDLATRMAKELLYEGARSGAKTMLTSCTACYVVMAARTHFTPQPEADQYKYEFEEPIRVNDLLQYAARFL